MSVTLKFYFKQFMDNMSEEDIRLTRLYNNHLMKSMQSLKQYFLKEDIMISYYGEYSMDDIYTKEKEDLVPIIKAYVFVLNDKYNFSGMCRNMSNISEYDIDEKYEFKVRFDTILNDITITKYAEYGTDENKHFGAKCKYYAWWNIEDDMPNKFYNIEE